MRLQAAQSDFGSGSIALFALSGWVFDGSRSLQTHILNESLPTCASVLLALASYARPAVLPQQIELRSSAARASPSDRSRNGAREEHEPAASDAAPARHLTLPLAYSGQGKLPRAAQIDIAASPRCLASART